MGVHVGKHAVIDPCAEIADGCEIGPYCTVGRHAVIEARTKLHSHVVVDGYTTIGSDCEVFPFVTLGVQSQDQKYVKGTRTFTHIGDRNTIREYVSIHSGTEAESTTKLGDDCALLAHAHVAHNCDIGNNVTMGHAATVGGHVTIGDSANLGGLCGVHQFCRIGTAAMVAGMARVTQDVLPFVIAEGFPASMRVVNKIGMLRAGYSNDAIREVRRAFRTLFMRRLRLEEAVELVENELGSRPHIQVLLDAIATTSPQGLARPDSDTFEINTDE